MYYIKLHLPVPTLILYKLFPCILPAQNGLSQNFTEYNSDLLRVKVKPLFLTHLNQVAASSKRTFMFKLTKFEVQ